MIKKQINKDEIENLPSGKYEGEICLVDNVLDIEQIFQEINSEKFWVWIPKLNLHLKKEFLIKLL